MHEIIGQCLIITTSFMEFLDPKNQRAHTIRLFIGYVLIATALVLTTIILLYQAYGFGLKNGQVIQNGLIFVSSTPGSADIYVNGKKRPETTNSRLLLPAGQYSFELQRAGYHSWKRAISLEGGALQRFDYPMLFPSKLVTQTTKKYTVKPTLTTQSPDRRWLITQTNTDYRTFDVFDLTKPDKDPTVISLPQTVSALQGTSSWKLVEWSNDNSHVLLQHSTDNAGHKATEYILLSRDKPEESVNLTTALGLNPTTLALRDKKFDQYFIYTQEDQKLQTASIAQPKPVLLLDHILGFKTYGDKTVLYATDKGAPAGKSLVKLQDNDKSYTLRTVNADPTYMLELTKYNGDWFMVAGAPSENRTYVYKNPEATLDAHPQAPLVPIQVLKTDNPTYVSFSDNARFIVTENGQSFSVYDAQYDKKYAFATKSPLDASQEHAHWMDGNRLTYVSGGKIVVFDYDNTNGETLVDSDATFGAFFDRDYKILYAMNAQVAKDSAGKDTTQFVLTHTAMRAPQDQ
jgi:hypothetical protein